MLNGYKLFLKVSFTNEQGSAIGCHMKFLEKILGKREPIPKLGRNDICWCGSGKKYKHCHLEADKKKYSKLIAATCTTFT
jgi:uncharacterized protein YecA (UPF0149 family)